MILDIGSGITELCCGWILGVAGIVGTVVYLYFKKRRK